MEVKMGLLGTWHNELGSTLVITEVQGDTIVGTYETAVSGSGCAKGIFPVIGRTDVDAGGTTLGFTITWRNDKSSCNSTTSWAGQYQVIDDQEVLIALWLLAMKTNVEEDWASTLVGEDMFFREPASPERQAEVATRKRHSHP
jgi:hypothetical protein